MYGDGSAVGMLGLSKPFFASWAAAWPGLSPQALSLISATMQSMLFAIRMSCCVITRWPLEYLPECIA